MIARGKFDVESRRTDLSGLLSKLEHMVTAGPYMDSKLQCYDGISHYSMNDLSTFEHFGKANLSDLRLMFFMTMYVWFYKKTTFQKYNCIDLSIGE